ncbi:MAG: FAD-dependent monooxygenase [Flavobacteriales bacterium]|nr:FAD-dependent monooxygenase [Flavobacteriales bacterium]MCW8911968.1 FAD-dependent monooxygenase [Flavobacteriales bacterium]MCW8937084.1 FAD-dependent monooxygenase [Flavobacteriales bacterium]MCW8941031.1 FAD-dependent monooxygenase [Flavobacteriales bacterium]MCW8968813.1 FAD-dependent monooxygenase [Flavobacteriales bacterium]
MKTATIVGAGLVGSLWAVYLSKAGYKVTIVERRSDIRKAEISAGKSINLALSTRGWKALDTVGVGDEIRKIAIPMPGRMMHDLKGNLTFQPYGKEGQAIYSVSRGGVNAKMMDIAEKHGNAQIFYNERCYKADLENGIVYTETASGEKKQYQSDVVFAADGAFSAVRYNSFQVLDRFNFSQNYIEDGYREILLPANADGSYKLEKNALHIWPRGRFMLIALPNEDGSFTCTLFMPFKGENSFETLTTKEAVNIFFKSTFPDFYDMMPNIADAWEDHPLSSLAIIRCYPWTHGKTALMGDAAHATVPFYGQGMNAGFEDCTVLWELMQKHDEDWIKVFEEYQTMRKPDGDGVQDLSLHNYYVMRDYVADPKFLLQKKIEAHFSEKYPDKWLPLYSQVTFSHIRYSEAWKKGQQQDAIMKKVMAEIEHIEEKWNSKEVENAILKELE